MSAGTSGRQRVERGGERARAMREQAERLQTQADAVDRRTAAIAQGTEGERIVGALLDELRAQGWVVLHDRRKTPRSPANLDHVVVGPMGVCVIDSKHWTGGRLHLDERGMRMKSWRKDDELHAARVDADLVAEVARGVQRDVASCGVLAFVQDVGLAEPVTHHGVVLAQREQLLGWLRSLPAVLSAADVARLGAHLDERFPARARAAPDVVVPPQRGSQHRAPAVTRTPSPPTAAQRREAARRDERARELRSLARTLTVVGVLLATVVLRPGLLTVPFAAVTERAGGAFSDWYVSHLPGAATP